MMCTKILGLYYHTPAENMLMWFWKKLKIVKVMLLFKLYLYYPQLVHGTQGPDWLLSRCTKLATSLN